MAARGRTRNDDEVQALLAMWADASIQRHLLGAVWNTTAFNKISDELVRKGYQRNTKQCREKLKQPKKMQESFIKESMIPWLHPNP